MKTLLALVYTLFLAVSVAGQSQSRPQTFDGVITLPNRNPPKPTASVSGVVVSETTAQPLAGARVTITRRNESALIALLLEEPLAALPEPVITDEAGSFSFRNLVPGGYSLSVRRAGYMPETLPVDPGQDRNAVTLRLTRSASIGGTIRSEAGAVMQNVPVAVVRADSHLRAAAATSNADGSYNLQEFLSGSYILIAGFPVESNGERAPSFAAPVTIRSTDPQRMDVALDTRGYSIRGRLTVSDGSTQPADVKVSVQIATPLGTGYTNDWVNMNVAHSYNPAQGTFAIPNLHPGVYRVSFSVTDTKGMPVMCGMATVLLARDESIAIALKPNSCML